MSESSVYKWYVLSSISRCITNFEGSPGPLRRAIERISSFHIHVATLIRFSVPRRMGPYFFTNQVNICRVSGSRSSQQSWPSSIADWTKLLNSICDDPDRVFFESQKAKYIKNKILRTAAEIGKAHTIHCECALIVFVDDKTSSLFSYIAVSKLSCHQWLQSYNDFLFYLLIHWVYSI